MTNSTLSHMVKMVRNDHSNGMYFFHWTEAHRNIVPGAESRKLDSGLNRIP